VNAQHFDSLEARLVCAAPTATIEAVFVDGDSLAVRVAYRGDMVGGVDLETIDINDVHMQGPGSLTLPTVARDAGVGIDNARRIVYEFPSQLGFWDFTDNGTYVIRSRPDEVLDESGEAVAAGLLASYYLWFSTPTAAVISSDVYADREWRIILEARDDGPLRALRIGDTVLNVESSRGFVVPGRVTRLVSSTPTTQRVEVTVPSPGRLFDYLDTATYVARTVAGAIADAAGFQMPIAVVASNYLWFTSPRVELLSTRSTDDRVIIDLRYSDDTFIDPQSFYGLRPAVSLEGPRPRGFHTLGRLVGTPTEGSDRSMLATFEFVSPGPYWSWQETGRYTVFILSGVNDIGGNYTGAGPVSESWLWWNKPAAALDESASSNVTTTEWSIELTFRPRATLTASAFDNGDIRVQGPSGFTAPGTLVSVVMDATGLWRARYHIASGDSEFANGTYRVFTVAGNVRDAAGGVTGAGFAGSFYLWFR